MSKSCVRDLAALSSYGTGTEFFLASCSSELYPPPSAPSTSAQYDPNDVKSKRASDLALRIFRQAFQPMEMQAGRKDRELITMVGGGGGAFIVQ